MGARVPPSLPFGGPESSLRHIRMVGVITSVFLLLPSFPSSSSGRGILSFFSHRSIIIILWHTISKWKTKSLQLRQTKFVIFWHVHNSTTNRTSSSLTQSSSPQGIVITLLILSSVFLVQPFLGSLSLLLFFLFNRLRSGWIIILLAWQNGLSLSCLFVLWNPICVPSFLLFCPGLSSSSNSSWPLSLSVHQSPFCTVWFFTSSVVVRP